MLKFVMKILLETEGGGGANQDFAPDGREARTATAPNVNRQTIFGNYFLAKTFNRKKWICVMFISTGATYLI